MVNLNGHAAGNGGHSQRTPKAHRGLLYSEGANLLCAKTGEDDYVPHFQQRRAGSSANLDSNVSADMCLRACFSSVRSMKLAMPSQMLTSTKDGHFRDAGCPVLALANKHGVPRSSPVLARAGESRNCETSY